MNKTLAEIAKLVDGEVVGDANLKITGVCGIKEAQEGDLTFVANSKYYSLIEKTKASAIIAPPDVNAPGKSVILTQNPSLAFASVVSLVTGDRSHKIKGIHDKACVADDAVVGKNVNIGPYAVIESGAKIGDNTTIYSNAFIGHEATVGQDCVIYPNVTIRENVILGSRVVIHSGTVIGSDGFGYVNVEGAHKKIPQTGTVVVGDDVEIGANVAIDRARFDKTVIGKGTKIDNLVQIAHNVQIGENCIIVSQVGISGSTIIGNNAILAGQAGLVGHITIGEGSVVASQAGVMKSVPAHTQVSGYPARPHTLAKKINGYLQRLPGYVKTINELKKRIEVLEAQFKE